MQSNEGRLAEILTRNDELRRLGQSTSIEDLCRDCPELIEDVRQRLQAAPLTGRPTDTFQSIDAIDLDSTDDLRPGAVPIPGYKLVHRLGRGGYGEVWKALAPGGFAVALKFVSQTADYLHLEQRSLEIIKALRHPNLLTTVGSWQTDEYLVIAMELADRTLQDRFHEAVAQGETGIPRDELLEYLYEAAKGIDFLNGQQTTTEGGERVGVQHRDIKPENILMVGNGVKVADFGLARLMERAQTGHTGNLTHMYAAPEFFKGLTTQHSDQYSLALTYCQLRAGRVPFQGSPAEVMYGHLTQPPDLSMLPLDERPIVARALSKTPTERWSSCLAFVHALKVGMTVQPPISRSAPARESVPQRTIGLAALGLAALCPIVAIGVYLSTHEFPFDRTKPVAPIRAESEAATRFKTNGLSELDDPEIESGRRTSIPTGTVSSGIGTTPTRPEKVETSQTILSEFVSKSTGMRLMPIPSGTFLMGSADSEIGRQSDEGPQHPVTISRPFLLGRFEVTQGEYELVMGRNPSYFSTAGSGPGNSLGGQDTRRFPVEEVSWYDAIEFCNRLSALDGLTPRYRLTDIDRHEGTIQSATVTLVSGTGYRLPTEAEWEYACRGTTTSPFYFGETLNGSQANVNGKFPYGTSKAGANLARSAVVGSYESNAAGVHDLHGNVMEWCWDVYDEKTYTAHGDDAKDPVVSSGSEFHVLRGGSWGDHPGIARSAHRIRITPASRYYTIGFRVVMDAQQTP